MSSFRYIKVSYLTSTRKEVSLKIAYGQPKLILMTGFTKIFSLILHLELEFGHINCELCFAHTVNTVRHLQCLMSFSGF